MKLVPKVLEVMVLAVLVERLVVLPVVMVAIQSLLRLPEEVEEQIVGLLVLAEVEELVSSLALAE